MSQLVIAFHQGKIFALAIFVPPQFQSSAPLFVRVSFKSHSHGVGPFGLKLSYCRASVFGSSRVCGDKRNLVASIACSLTTRSNIATFVGVLAALRAIRQACT